MIKTTLNKRIELNSFLIALLLNVKSFPVVFGEISHIVIMGVAIVFLLILLLNTENFFKGRSALACAVPAILVFTCILNILLSTHKITEEYAFMFFGLGIPFLFLPTINIRLDSIVKYFSFIGIICIPFYYARFKYIQLGDDELLMSMSYRILPYIISSIIMIFSFKNKVYVLLFEIISALFYLTSLLSFGSRGPIVCVLAFCVFYYVSTASSKKAKIRRIAISVGAVVLIVVAFNTIINRLLDSDFSMRSVERMYYYMSNDRDVTSGRDNIYRIAYNEFMASPIIGNGIGSFNNYCGIYPHNVLLQIMQELGILFAFPFLYCLLITLVYIIKHSTSEPYYICLIFLFFSGVLGLFFSQNFWGGYMFWTYVWMLINRKQLLKQSVVVDKIRCLRTNGHL